MKTKPGVLRRWFCHSRADARKEPRPIPFTYAVLFAVPNQWERKWEFRRNPTPPEGNWSLPPFIQIVQRYAIADC
jgi:hypothetical protein